MEVTVSRTPAQSIELKPTGAQAASLTVEGQIITLEPTHRYRFTLAKIRMLDEAASLVIVTEAPLDKFVMFMPLADRVISSVKFA